MNESGVYSMRDRVADRFLSIVLDVNEQTAKRNFTFAVNNNKEMMFQAKDLELCKVGVFNSHTGVISPVNPIMVICRGDEVIDQTNS